MTIPLPLAEIIVKDLKVNPLKGSKALMLGQSAVCADISTIQKILQKNQVFQNIESLTVQLDTSTQLAEQYPDKNFILAETFLQLLGLEDIDVLDISAYEGANIQHDICSDLPEHLVGVYDFVFNASVLDNVFDPAQALKNMNRTLKPEGGRIVHIEMATNDKFPYLVFTPGWFLDYYAINHFKRCQIYLAQYNTVEELLFGPWLMWGCMPLTNLKLSAPTLQGSSAILVIIAERESSSTIDINPIQGHYRSQEEQSRINTSLDRFSSMPFYTSAINEYNIGGIQEIAQWQWCYCGKW